ncbi:MAG: Riboflavin biosynthesis protein RibF [Candidatus Erwinia impunctatus]|nr:Riboflavin biosynthesis protein RibF [Culicoides impunctatus]
MKFIRGLHNLKTQRPGCVLTIGNFDGVHLGHQGVLARLREEGQHRQLPVMVMLFEPQPLELFSPDSAPARLTRLREKIHYLQQAGVDSILCIRFDQQFSSLSAESFIRELLIDKIHVKFLAVGDDFRFGTGREGNFLLLEEAGKRYGFDVVSTQTINHGDERISSTAIRHSLASDDFSHAEQLLGHPFIISGRVVRGDALGRTLGFPTANIPLRRTVSPVQGVYAVRVAGISEHPLPGVANIGTRPTLAGIRQQLEVHLFDITQDLYGKHIEVILCKKIRSEQRFASLEALKEQIAKDVVIARHFFGLKVHHSN